MSRIGKKPVTIPKGVSVSVTDRTVSVTGPRGELVRRLHQEAGLASGELILISIHDPDDFAELIAASPAGGFLSKADLSAGAILGLLGAGPRPG